MIFILKSSRKKFSSKKKNLTKQIDRHMTTMSKIHFFTKMSKQTLEKNMWNVKKQTKFHQSNRQILPDLVHIFCLI